MVIQLKRELQKDIISKSEDIVYHVLAEALNVQNMIAEHISKASIIIGEETSNGTYKVLINCKI